MLGALMLYGLKPGPMLFHTNPDFVWAVIASMFIGNVILIFMNLPMIPFFAMGLRIPYRYLYPAILLICIIGAYSLSNSVYDVWVMLIFGVFGYFMKKYDIPGGPMVVALVLGPMLEYNLYRALALSHGNLATFVTRPISGTLLAIAAVMVVVMTLKAGRMKKVLVEEKDE
jgi:putative tricarboxylic transport membrane protein